MHEVHWPVRLANLWGTGPSDKSPLLCDQSTLYTYMIFLNKFTVLKEWQHQKNDAEVDLWSPHQHIPMPLHQYTCTSTHTQIAYNSPTPTHKRCVCHCFPDGREKKEMKEDLRLCVLWGNIWTPFSFWAGSYSSDNEIHWVVFVSSRSYFLLVF